jgi:predicted nucleic acid-binding protein
MESPLLGVILDSSAVIAAERKRQTVEQLLMSVWQAFGEVEIAIPAVTLAELVHGVARANTNEVRSNRRFFIDELKEHVPVHPVTESTAEIAGLISGEQARRGITVPSDDLLIGASNN